MKYLYVYILECSDGSYYVGIANDYERRLHEHSIGVDKKCYTYRRRPVRAAYVQEFTSTHDATVRERQLKRWSHAKKKALIDGDEKLLGTLAWNRTGVITVRASSAGLAGQN